MGEAYHTGADQCILSVISMVTELGSCAMPDGGGMLPTGDLLYHDLHLNTECTRFQDYAWQ